jgi:hypothetical protein
VYDDVPTTFGDVTISFPTFTASMIPVLCNLATPELFLTATILAVSKPLFPLSDMENVTVTDPSAFAVTGISPVYSCSQKKKHFLKQSELVNNPNE